MLNTQFKPHRAHLAAANANPQKVFAMLKLVPQAEVARARPPLAFALVIDTSGSMREFADQQKAKAEIQMRGLQYQQQAGRDGAFQGVNLSLPTKLDQAIQASHSLADDDRLNPEDKIVLVHFDDDARTLLPLTPLANKSAVHQAIDSLSQFSGGTHMAKGLRCAQRELEYLTPEVAKRVLLLTDGRTFDEPDCPSAAQQLADANTPVIGVGIGDEYNEALLRDMASITNGRPYHLQSMSGFRDILNEEVGSSVREVVTDLQATVSTVKGVTLDSLTRVYASLSDINVSTQPYRLGNVPAGDFTIFLFEFTVSGIARPASRVRLAQLGLVGHAPALQRRDEFPPQDLFVTFTTDEAAAAEVDAEVMGYVQQKNVDGMVQKAMQLATVDAGRARQTLQAAIGMTQRVGNAGMTKILSSALDELNQTGTISPGTRKTVALGGRTKTVKTGATKVMEGLPSDEDIRKLTGA